MSLGAPLGTTEVIFCGQKRSICLTAKKERQSVLQFEFIRWSRYGKYGYNIWIVGKDMEYMDRYGRSGAGVQTLRVGLSTSEILISKFIGFQRTTIHGETSNIHAGKLCFDYMTIWTDICKYSVASIQYWRLKLINRVAIKLIPPKQNSPLPSSFDHPLNSGAEKPREEKLFLSRRNSASWPRLPGYDLCEAFWKHYYFFKF